jgi:hypothetical protein
MTTNLARLLTASDAARVLNVGVSTVIRWINNGEILPVGKLAGPRGTWLIAESEVYDLAERRRAELLQRLPQPTPPALAGAGVSVSAQGVA